MLRVWDSVAGRAGSGCARARSRRPGPVRGRRATALYEDIVLTGGIDRRRPADRSTAAPSEPPSTCSSSIGLLTGDRDAARYVADRPGRRCSRGSCPRSANEGSRLLQESSSWASAFAPLAQAWRRAPASTRLVRIRSRCSTAERASTPFIAGLVAECEDEMLTAQPQTGRDAETLAAAAVRDTAMLERGTKMRTLYQHSARRSAITTRLRRRGDRARRRGAHARRVLQPDDRHRPPGRRDPRQAGGPRPPRS